MSYRKTPLVKNEIYHVFNRGIASQPIFQSQRDYQRALEVFRFYQFKDLPLRFSFYNRLTIDKKFEFLSSLEETEKLVEIICFCLMPNHIHFLLKNLMDNGITKFMSRFLNSYAKYFNTRTERTGSLFQQNFKAVRIESDEQLIHVSRYIHLNPVTNYIIKPKELGDYPWSSYPDYLQGSSEYLYINLVLDYFKNPKNYQKFVLDQVDYQRELDKIKHLKLE